MSAPDANGWMPIETAPLDAWVQVYCPPREGLSSIKCVALYHPDAGWCVDELRFVTHWQPIHYADDPVTL